MDTLDAKIYVKEHLSQRAILLQLAEGAAELSSAASKLVRILDGENPSPTSPQKARENVIEEYGDVLDCIDIWITASENQKAMEARNNKFIQWAKILQERRSYNANEHEVLTDDEYEICRLLGAKWVTKDECWPHSVQLWDIKPKMYYYNDEKSYEGHVAISNIQEDRFPSLKRGDIVSVINGYNEI